MDITELLIYSVRNSASDLHVSAGEPPAIRVDGKIRRMDSPPLDHPSVLALLYDIMNDSQRKAFEACYEVDFSFEIANLARFRVNVFNHSRGAGGVFRTIPLQLKSIDDLGLPKQFKKICALSRGLVLVTGPTGSGKTTTLSAMLEFINQSQQSHILTIEDPIEFLHQSKNSLINQREVYRHTLSFSAALRSALREDPDVIMVGEMRDLETIRLALTAAETGHLVFGTLHTSSATKTINRIIDVFPPEEKSVVRTILSESLQAVICQTLVPKITGGRIAALEILLTNPAIRNQIREDKIAQMYSVIHTNTAMGMQTLDQHLQALVAAGEIARFTAREVAVNKDLFC